MEGEAIIMELRIMVEVTMAAMEEVDDMVEAMVGDDIRRLPGR